MKTGDRIRVPRLVLVLALVVVVTGCAQAFAARPSPAGEIEVVLTDYAFSPNAIRVKAGQAVRFILRNEGRHAHEFMIGRHPVVHQDYLQGPVIDAFEVDFFEGLEVHGSGEGMFMNFPGMGMEMEGMDMGDDEQGGMEMGGEEGEGHAEGEGGMEMGGEDAPHEEEEAPHAEEEAVHHGGMVMLDPAEADQEVGPIAVLEVTITKDKIGTWEIGCFEEDGQHFEDGMRAILIVEG